MIDTHCHLNFKAFRKNLPDVIDGAKKAGVNQIIVPGTDLETSKKAVEIAQIYEGVWAAVGIHPHHAYEIINDKSEALNSKFQTNSNYQNSNVQNKKVSDLEELLSRPKVVAVGEIGLDKHQYQKTKYENYRIDSELVELQKELLGFQIKLAIKYKKAVILHSRESTTDILDFLTHNSSFLTPNKIVFHCCEPDDRLLDFAIKNNIYIGVDGDVTYWEDKKEFVKKIPLELLVLETDSPYLLPEPLKSEKAYPNEPKNLPLIAEFIANLRNISINQIIEATVNNSKKLFSI